MWQFPQQETKTMTAEWKSCIPRFKTIITTQEVNFKTSPWHWPWPPAARLAERIYSWPESGFGSGPRRPADLPGRPHRARRSPDRSDTGVSTTCLRCSMCLTCVNSSNPTPRERSRPERKKAPQGHAASKRESRDLKLRSLLDCLYACLPVSH